MEDVGQLGREAEWKRDGKTVNAEGKGIQKKYWRPMSLNSRMRNEGKSIRWKNRNWMAVFNLVHPRPPVEGKMSLKPRNILFDFMFFFVHMCRLPIFDHYGCNNWIARAWASSSKRIHAGPPLKE